jgi:hypothetical protein
VSEDGQMKIAPNRRVFIQNKNTAETAGLASEKKALCCSTDKEQAVSGYF